MPEERADIQRPDWWEERQKYLRHANEMGWPHWRVIVRLDCKQGEQIFSDLAPHPAGAKKQIQKRLDDECSVTEWVDTYIPRPSWDCPNCHTNEAMSTVPNLRGKWDWSCALCGYRTVGHPYDPDEEGGIGDGGLYG